MGEVGGGVGGARGAVDYDVVTADGKILRHCLPENLVSVRPGTRVSLAPDGWSAGSSDRQCDLKRMKHVKLMQVGS